VLVVLVRVAKATTVAQVERTEGNLLVVVVVVQVLLVVLP
jgi:hypothetical protein